MSRFFHTLVVVGAALSASACGGKSERTLGDDDAQSGSGGTASGSGAAGGSAGNTGGSGAGGVSTSGGTSGAGGSTSGGTGGAGTGGSSGVSAGGSGGDIMLTGGTGALGGSGAAGASSWPTPGPTAQWSCGNVNAGCVDVQGKSAMKLTGDCPVDPMLAASPAACSSDQIFTCQLALTVAGETVLTDCFCWDTGGAKCVGCFSVANNHNGAPLFCDESLNICGCAYTGILR